MAKVTMPNQRVEILNLSILSCALKATAVLGLSLFETKKTCKIKNLHVFPQVRRQTLSAQEQSKSSLPSAPENSGLALRSDPFVLGVQLVQRREVSLGGGNDDVRIAAHAVDHPAAMLQPNGDLAL